MQNKKIQISANRNRNRNAKQALKPFVTGPAQYSCYVFFWSTRKARDYPLALEIGMRPKTATANDCKLSAITLIIFMQ